MSNLLDGSRHLIDVASLNGSMRTMLIWTNLDKPRDIIVDPLLWLQIVKLAVN
jgi:hypothetical protein